MKEMHDEVVEQMLERIGNALGQIQKYRASHLDNPRLEDILTQLERVEQVIEEKGRLEYREKLDLDFHLIEDTPLEGNSHLGRELYSIKNFTEHNL
ncbi:MAG: hypothetical protein AB202_03395 [Parcubacteria bacterium C7867-007]|nr:MAG: hypothetical protein AB202_03395 [Parcubacteria bacterium C7867-007]